MSLLGRARIRRSTELHTDGRRISSTTLRVTGLALASLSVVMVVGTVVEAATTRQDTVALASSAAVTFGIGAVLSRMTERGSIRPIDIFAAVGWSWLAVTVLGAMPYLLGGTFAVEGIDRSGQWVNAFFESAAGFSCTGSTALTDFSVPGRGMLMYRQLTQWYGGMGIVVLAVAVLPTLGVGGLDLMSAEAPGPVAERLTPHVRDHASRLWAAYVLLTVAVAVALVIVPGPSVYDAIAHALTTASTGGFSPYGASIGHFDSVAVEVVLMVGMIIGGANFVLHWRALRREGFVHRRDAEFRLYITMLLVCSVVVVVILWLDGGLGFTGAVRAGVFNVVSLGTSTGYGNATGPGSAGDFVTWLPGAQFVLLFLFVVGASSQSTAGGIKVFRLQVLLSHSIRSVRRSQHPRAVIPVKHGGSAVREDVVSRMASFFTLYALLVLVGILLLTALSGGFIESIGAVLGALGNMGPALGTAGPTANFTDAFSEPARMVLAVYMLIGRLEIIPIFLMFAAPARAMRRR